MEREKLIIYNHSSKPLHESYELAFECYFQNCSEEQQDFTATGGNFIFYGHANKESFMILICDKETTL